MSVTSTFHALGLPSHLLSSLAELGYEVPTPIQEQSIPVLVSGKDLLAQAKTGSGKTAAFALPILSQLDISCKAPQALILVPTRELAIQVAEAFQRYAKDLNGFHVSPIYGGQSYTTQLRALKRGTHVIVGTPGRLMDHMRRGVIVVDSLKTVVLDEADEMLKMGFIDDIQWILEQIPQNHQTALFSATMPKTIQDIAQRYLYQPTTIQIKAVKGEINSIDQYVMCVRNEEKLEALTRFLEVEDVQAAIIFARTKTASVELADKLQARGHAVSSLNGDMKQSLREKVIDKIKEGTLDIIVATDVAARGIDVPRLTHVINYDIPHDVESYIHRIGRTGRAGRAGKAILFATPRERRLLKDIEYATQVVMKPMALPSVAEMQQKRSQQLAEKIIGVIENKGQALKVYRDMVANIIEQAECEPLDVAAALAYLSQVAKPLPSKDLTPAVLEDDRGSRGGDSRGRRRSPSRFGGGGDRDRSGDRGNRERSSRGSNDRPFRGDRDRPSGGFSRRRSRDK